MIYESECIYLIIPVVSVLYFQMEFDEKELRKEISYAIKNIHGIRHVCPPSLPSILTLPLHLLLSLHLSHLCCI